MNCFINEKGCSSNNINSQKMLIHIDSSNFAMISNEEMHA